MARILRFLAFTVLGALSVVPSLIRADGCSGKVTWGPGTSSVLDCENPCDELCQSLLIEVPGAGQGAVCICTGEGWTGCCTVVLFPPNGTGAALAQGDCGVGGCPWSGECAVNSAILQGPPKWILVATPYCTG